MKPRKNIGASVHHRLKNAAKDSGRSFNDLAQYHALERWLYRLSKSYHSDLFILKGALMLVAWRAPILRATRDIDLLARTKNDLDNIKTVIAEICREEVPDDGVVFDAESVTTERIAEDADYKGIRAQFRGHLATTRLTMQIDMGFIDVLHPLRLRSAIQRFWIIRRPSCALTIVKRQSPRSSRQWSPLGVSTAE